MRAVKEKEMSPDPRLKRRFVFILILFCAVPMPALSQEAESFQPIRRIRLQPRAADQFPPQSEEVTPSTKGSLPEHRPVDEGTWRSLKEFARSDSKVKEPDTIVL